MQIGRFIFGIGGESLAVAQNTYAVSWFKGKELNMVFGFQLSVARVGSTVNFSVMAPLYKYIERWGIAPHTAVGWTLMIAGLTCIMSFLCAILLGWMDKRADRILKKSVSESGEGDVVSFSILSPGWVDFSRVQTQEGIFGFGFWVIISYLKICSFHTRF